MSPKLHIGNVILEKRQTLGLTTEVCASACGLNIESYSDVESTPSEFIDNISLGTARRLANKLGLDLLDIASRFLGVGIVSRMFVDDTTFYSRHELVLATRLHKGMSELVLANSIGFEPSVVHALERSADFIETLPICVVAEVAQALTLDPGFLLCNRSRSK